MRVAIVMLGFQAHFRHHRQRFSRRCSLLRLLLISSGSSRICPTFYAGSANHTGSGTQSGFLPPQLLRLRVVLKQILPLIIELAAGGDLNHRQQTTEGRFAAARLPTTASVLPRSRVKETPSSAFTSRSGANNPFFTG